MKRFTVLALALIGLFTFVAVDFTAAGHFIETTLKVKKWMTVGTATKDGRLTVKGDGTNDIANFQNSSGVDVLEIDADGDATVKSLASDGALSATTGTFSAKVTVNDDLLVDGIADQVQLTVAGHSTQTSDIFVVETSADADMFTVDNSGEITATSHVNGVNGVFSGAVSGTTGTFSGLMTVNDAALIDGDADEVQLTVQAHSTNTSNLFVCEDSAAADVFAVDLAGKITAASHVEGVNGVFSGAVSGTTITGSGKLTINDDALVDGIADQVQLTVAGHSTQTAKTFVVETSGGADVMTVDNDGNIIAVGGAFSGAVTADAAVTLGNAADDVVTMTGTVAGASPLAFEGATADDYELTLAVTDPTADRTVTVPDYSGDLKVVLSQGTTQMSCVDGTSDVTGSELVFVDGGLEPGVTIKWTAVGTITGANAAKNVILYIDNAAIVTLATQAATAGDYMVECWMHEYTDYAHQRAYCKMVVAAGADVEFDMAVDTTDFNDGGPTTVKMQIVSGNAGDTITVDHVFVEMFD